MTNTRHSTSHIQHSPWAILLAAGQGKRMGGDLPKVVYPVAGEPMIRWVVRACRGAGVSQCVVVVGHQGQMVREALADMANCTFVEQKEQLGTAHATQAARPALGDLATRADVDVFVLAGDGPLIRADTLTRLLDEHRQTKAAATLATAVLEDPMGYGRVVRDDQGDFARIVEQKDAGPAELAIREVNPSYYCFRADALFETLAQVGNANKQGEYYLTDVPGLLKARGEAVSLVDAVPAEDVLSINTPEQLEAVDGILRARSEEVGYQPLRSKTRSGAA